MTAILALMTPADWVASGLGLLGLIGGAIGFFTSRSARKGAAAAQVDATTALTKSAVAAERAANALEEANRLYAESIKAPLWGEQWKGRDRIFLINRTGAVARDVEARVLSPREERYFSVAAGDRGGWTVEPGSALEFLWHNVDQSTDQLELELSWLSPTSLDRITEKKLLLRP